MGEFGTSFGGVGGHRIGAKQQAHRCGGDQKFTGHENRPFVVRPAGRQSSPCGCPIVRIFATLLWPRPVSNKAIRSADVASQQGSAPFWETAMAALAVRGPQGLGS